MIEKLFLAVPAQTLTADGTSSGQIKIPSTAPFKVKQKVWMFSNTLPDKVQFEIKRIVDGTTMWLGPAGPEMKKYADLTLYLVVANATIYADEQDRNAIPFDKWVRAVFDEEPTLAIRTSLVDYLGNKFSTSNPLPVQLSDGSINVETLNADLRVQLSSKDNDPTAGDVHSSVRIGDQNHEMKVNPDGSINVVPEGSGITSSPTVPTFNEVTAVPVNSETLIVTYTVPIGKTAVLDHITGSGENVGKYSVYINNVLSDVRRTYYATDFNVVFDYKSMGAGVTLNPGDKIDFKILHTGPDIADFDGRIQVVELG